MNPTNLSQIYEKRFTGFEEYRKKVWKVLVDQFFSKWINSEHSILDLGCGYSEFINNAKCNIRHAMDLNPKSKEFLDKNIIFHEQDCSKPWSLEPESLEIVFTSNFFEHLPTKNHLDRAITNIHQTLKPNGILIAMGPNIAILNGKYWDFWDHHVALSEQSLCELLQIHDMTIEESHPKFLPYNMVRARIYPLFLVSLYLKLPLLWRIWGKQFLIIARKNKRK